MPCPWFKDIEHSYVPKDPCPWDASVREAYHLFDKEHSWINKGLAIGEQPILDSGKICPIKRTWPEAAFGIDRETDKAKKYLKDYMEGRENSAKFSYHLGRLSHYAADLSQVIHSYTVSTWGDWTGHPTYGLWSTAHRGIYENNVWIEGIKQDIAWEWKQGWAIQAAIYSPTNDLPVLGNMPGMCDKLEFEEAANATWNSVSDPKEGYQSLTDCQDGGHGYKYLSKDFDKDSCRNETWIKTNAVKQAVIAISATIYGWCKVLETANPKSLQGGIDLPIPPEELACSANNNPPMDVPDDNAGVTLLSSSMLNFELLDKSWKRIGVKKDRKIIIMRQMLLSLYNEQITGNLDKNRANQLAQSYGSVLDMEENFYEDIVAAPDVAILSRGMALFLEELLEDKLSEPVRKFTLDDFTPEAIADYPILIIPTGALSGLDNSLIFREKLAQYVQNGGTVIMLSQQYGTEFSLLPVPEESDNTFKPIEGYGWAEDQACFSNSAFINMNHQMFAGQTITTPSLNIDGYFTSYPSSSTVLLRRTANGQPAMIMYEYGAGRVIASTLYPDFGFSHGQTSNEEIALLRDLIYWAKKPATLPEIILPAKRAFQVARSRCKSIKYNSSSGKV